MLGSGNPTPYDVPLFVPPTTNGIIGAGRVLFIWPALAAGVIAYLVWSWRVGRL